MLLTSLNSLPHWDHHRLISWLGIKREKRIFGTTKVCQLVPVWQTQLITAATGNWLDLAPIPHDRTLEALERKLEDKTGFLRFIRRTLTWMPEERPTARELLQDPWLTEGTV